MNQTTRSPGDMGSAIKQARKAAKLTQTDLAALSGIWQETISRIENGQTGTKIETLFALFAALGLDLVVTDRGKAASTDLASPSDRCNRELTSIAAQLNEIRLALVGEKTAE
jgi:HTH-type transcriptional regulator/antitoxin HipB